MHDGNTNFERKENYFFVILRRIFIKHIFTFCYPVCFCFLVKFRWIQRLLLSETMDVSSWNVSHSFKAVWKWSSSTELQRSVIWDQDLTNVSFISSIHVCFLSSVIRSLIGLPTSAVLLKVPYVLPKVWTRTRQIIHLLSLKYCGIKLETVVHTYSVLSVRNNVNEREVIENYFHRGFEYETIVSFLTKYNGTEIWLSKLKLRRLSE